MTSKAFLDTTVYTDLSLKLGRENQRAKEKFYSYEQTLLAVYAIKEFKDGPFSAYVWIHNKLVSTKSLSQTMGAIQANMAHRKYLPSTALQALAESTNSIASNLGELVSTYGQSATPDRVMADEMRLHLRRVIIKAWQQRRSITSAVVDELPCYAESPPRVGSDGMIVSEDRKCRVVSECSLAEKLRTDIESLKKLRAANSALPSNNERSKRGRALKQLTNTPKRLLTEKQCRDLGDAIFAFFAPADSEILTTNLKDHEPLADALGKKVASP